MTVDLNIVVRVCVGIFFSGSMSYVVCGESPWYDLASLFDISVVVVLSLK